MTRNTIASTAALILLIVLSLNVSGSGPAEEYSDCPSCYVLTLQATLYLDPGLAVELEYPRLVKLDEGDWVLGGISEGRIAYFQGSTQVWSHAVPQTGPNSVPINLIAHLSGKRYAVWAPRERRFAVFEDTTHIATSPQFPLSVYDVVGLGDAHVVVNGRSPTPERFGHPFHSLSVLTGRIDSFGADDDQAHLPGFQLSRMLYRMSGSAAFGVWAVSRDDSVASLVRWVNGRVASELPTTAEFWHNGRPVRIMGVTQMNEDDIALVTLIDGNRTLGDHSAEAAGRDPVLHTAIVVISISSGEVKGDLVERGAAAGILPGGRIYFVRSPTVGTTQIDVYSIVRDN